MNPLVQLLIKTIPALYALLAVVPIWLLLRIVTHFSDRKPRESVRCRRCWYDLRGNVTGNCPECGAEIKRVGAWLPEFPDRRRWVNNLGIWLTCCAIPLAYLGQAYEEATKLWLGNISIHAVVDKLARKSAILDIRGRQIKLPFVPVRTLPADVTDFGVFVEKGLYYSVTLKDNPKVVWFDHPTTLSAGTVFKKGMLEQATEQVFSEPLPEDVDAAMRFILQAAERLVQGGRFPSEKAVVEGVANQVYLDIGSPAHYELEIEFDISIMGLSHMPAWVRWVPAIPLAAIWLVGAYLITRRLRHRGVVWSIKPDMDYR